MKVIIAGSRKMTMRQFDYIEDAVKASGFEVTEVVCGGAPGVDTLGKVWAKMNSIPVTIMKAEWDKYGNAAGPRRNRQMAQYADAAVVVWDGQSVGSRDMIACMKRVGKPCKELVVPFDSKTKRFQRRPVIKGVMES